MAQNHPFQKRTLAARMAEIQGRDKAEKNVFFALAFCSEINISKMTIYRKKNGLFCGQTDRKGQPPPLQSALSVNPEIMIICVLKWILHKEKVIFIQLQAWQPGCEKMERE